MKNIKMSLAQSYYVNILMENREAMEHQYLVVSAVMKSMVGAEEETWIILGVGPSHGAEPETVWRSGFMGDFFHRKYQENHASLQDSCSNSKCPKAYDFIAVIFKSILFKCALGKKMAILWS